MGRILVWRAEAEALLQLCEASAASAVREGHPHIDREWLDDLGEKHYRELTQIETRRVQSLIWRWDYKLPERSWKYWRPWANKQWQRRRR